MRRARHSSGPIGVSRCKTTSTATAGTDRSDAASACHPAALLAHRLPLGPRLQIGLHISSDGTGLLLLSCVAGSVPLGGVLIGLTGPGGPKAADAGVVDLLHSGLGTGRSRSAWLVWFARRRTKLAFWRMLSLSHYGSKWLSVNEQSLTRCTTHTVVTISMFVSVRPKAFVYRWMVDAQSKLSQVII